MARNNLLFICTGTFVVLLLAPPSLSADPPLAEPEVPEISEADRLFLSRLARRTLRDFALERETYSPGYVPMALERITSAEVMVRLRLNGFLLAEAVGGPSSIALATRDAALSAMHIWRKSEKPELGEVNRLLIEMEAIGLPQPIPVVGDWTQPRAVDAFIEPAVHGMVLKGSRGLFRFCPTEVFTSDTILADSLKNLAQHLHDNPAQLSDAVLMRFRTVHWYEPPSGADVVSLHRGLTPVPAASVNQRNLGESIDRLAEYMCYRQKANGMFTYQYEPAKDLFTDEDNVVRQAGATLAMAFHARWSGSSASHAAAKLAIRHQLDRLTNLPHVENAAFIATEDGKNKLGVTALLSLTLAVHPDADEYAPVREKLLNGMLGLQRESGMFITAFPPAQEIGAQDYFPGEALLALAAEYDRSPNARIMEAFDRAIEFYRAYFRDSSSPAFVPWQVQAFALMAKHTKRKDYIDFAFELTDWLAAMQLNASNCPWPEMWGGIASYQPGRAGVATASYLEAFADALDLARRVGDDKRAQSYEPVVRSAARFVTQLQIRPEEAYFIRSPSNAVGGIRTSPSLNLLRIDHCQHALIGLIKSKEVLYPRRG